MKDGRAKRKQDLTGSPAELTLRTQSNRRWTVTRQSASGHKINLCRVAVS